jgi:hypothetical protein
MQLSANASVSEQLMSDPPISKYKFLDGEDNAAQPGTPHLVVLKIHHNAN